MKKRLFVLTTVLAAGVVASLQAAATSTGAGAAAAQDPGITRTTIVLGGTFPLSGPASLYAPIPRGMDAYFKYVNSRRGRNRGVNGRQIVWKYYDDGYNPAQTVQLHNRLILQDRVFGIVGTLGTEPNLAVRPLLNSRRVPQILVSTGASYWGLQYRRYPWTIGWQPDYVAEGRAYGRWIARNAPRARIAVFYQNDDYGKDYLRGLRSGLGRRARLIVSEQGYEITDTSYGSQLARQKASGADTWVLLTTPTPTVRAIATAKALNWNPARIVINSVSATDTVMDAAAERAGASFVNGAISTAYLKNPADPAYRNDPAVRQYRRILARFGPANADPNNTFFYYGVAKAYDTVRLLRRAGRNPTRASLMRATQHMNWVNPFAIKGIRVKTSARDRFPISQIKIVRYRNRTWKEVGSLINGR
ncbi:MAG: ABC transporter substrate-binding protein [Actinomycetota bacterium]|jgi:branched-chain amino acid transport system substrate-binding protein|nr:ABC transporter substrate-binding protein [Actinomycetota bacterium]